MNRYCIVGVLGVSLISTIIWETSAYGKEAITEAKYADPLPLERTAELRLNCKRIYGRGEPMPQGIVDENPPVLYHSSQYDQGERGQLRFEFRLSQDSTFSSTVIESDSRPWSFFRPVQPLTEGTWFWQCRKEGQNWSTPLSFLIRGNEHQITVPSIDEFLHSVRRAGRPRVLSLKEDIGHLMPENDPQLREGLFQACQNVLKKEVPESFVLDESVIPKELASKLTQNQKDRYVLLRIRDFSSKSASNVNQLIKAYLLTGKPTYREAALSAIRHLHKGFEELEQKRLAHEFALAAYYFTIGNALDVFYDDLTPAERSEFVHLVAGEARSLYLAHVNRIEDNPLDEHGWQASVRSLFQLSLLSYGEVPEAEIWLRYTYDLWNFRGPQVGRTDGGSLIGNGYFGAHEGTLLELPFLMSRLTGINYFDDPWYHNVGKYLVYASPAGYPAGAYGDNADRGMNKMERLTCLLEHAAGNTSPWFAWRNKTLRDAGQVVRARDYLDRDWWLLHDYRPEPNRVPFPPDAWPAAAFPDVGTVAMHSDLEHQDHDMVVTFRANPFGVDGHAHAAQNAFNVMYGGDKVFFKTGYYTSSGDTHSLQDYKHSRAQNTILADGIGMDYENTGYGWLARFVTGRRISYCLGDSSNAYNGNYNVHQANLERSGLKPTRENGFGDPGVTRFRRHLVMLPPSLLVIYDELEADKPVEWTMRLNSPHEIRKTKTAQTEVTTEHSRAAARLFCLDPIAAEVTNEFFGGEALDHHGKFKEGTPNQYHASFRTAKKEKSTRFLTLVEVVPVATNQTNLLAAHVELSGSLVRLKMNGYSIHAELDASKSSLISISSDDGNCALVSGQAVEQIQLGAETRSAKLKGSTLLWEKESDKERFFEVIDQLPDAVIHGNLY